MQDVKDFLTFKNSINKKFKIFEIIAAKYINEPKYCFVISDALHAFRYILNDKNVLERFYYDRKQYEDPLPGFSILLSKIRGLDSLYDFELSIPTDLENEIYTLIEELKQIPTIHL